MAEPAVVVHIAGQFSLLSLFLESEVFDFLLLWLCLALLDLHLSNSSEDGITVPFADVLWEVAAVNASFDFNVRVLFLVFFGRGVSFVIQIVKDVVTLLNRFIFFRGFECSVLIGESCLGSYSWL